MSQAGLLSVAGSGGVTSLRGDDNNLVSPAAGVIDVDGIVVVNATNAKPLFTDGAVANTLRLEIQVGAAIASAPGDTNDAGIVSFDSSSFSVDADGFVQLVGSGGFTWNVVAGTSEDLEANNGYITSNVGLTTFTLPVTASIGATFQIVGEGSGGWDVAQNAGQQIHFGNQSTTAGVGGALASTHQRDCIEIVCIATDTTFSVIDSIGTITVT